MSKRVLWVVEADWNDGMGWRPVRTESHWTREEARRRCAILRKRDRFQNSHYRAHPYVPREAAP